MDTHNHVQSTQIISSNSSRAHNVPTLEKGYHVNGGL